MVQLYDKKISVTYSGISLEAYDYLFRQSDRTSETIFTNGTVRTTVSGKTVNTVSVRGRMTSGKITQFVTLFSPLIGSSNTLLLDGFTLSAVLDSFELSPSDVGGLTDFTLNLH